MIAVLPLPLSRSRFADSVFEWLELFVVPLVVLALAVAVAAGLSKLFRIRPAAVLEGAITASLLGFLTVVGWIVTGTVGALVAPTLFAVIFVVARPLRQGRPGWPWPYLRTGATLLSSLLITGIGFWEHRPAQPQRQVVMVGLDGATWEVIDRLREAGALPTFERLVLEGARGELDTLTPVISPPIWTSIATGTSPEHHGVSDFWASANQVRVKRIWDVADDHGLTSGVFGYLVTWPPRKESGFMVPGWLAQGPETVPPYLSFFKRLEIGEKAGEQRSLGEMVRLTLATLRHGVTLSTLNSALVTVASRRLGEQDDRDRALQVRIVKLKLATDVFCQLLRHRQPPLAIFYDSSIDAIQHLFFKYYDSDGFPEVTAAEAASFGDAVPEVYREADRALERIIEAAAADANIVVVSDHGQEAAASEGAAWYVINSSALLADLEIASEIRATNVGRSVFLRSIGGEAGMTEALDQIRQVVTADDGRPLFEIRRRGPEEAYLGIREDFALPTSPSVETSRGLLPTRRFVRTSDRVSGVHTETALMVMKGPEIREGVTFGRHSVLDVAPTVLYLLGLPISRELQGQPVSTALRPAFLVQVPIKHVDSYGAPQLDEPSTDESLNEETLEKLKSLGYIQ